MYIFSLKYRAQLKKLYFYADSKWRKQTMRILLLAMILAVFSACVSENRQAAGDTLDRAKEWIQNGQMEKGVSLLDSIPVWYPEEYKIIGEALELKKHAAGAYHREFIQQASEILANLEPQVEEWSKNFVFIPGPPGRPGIWEHKRQRVTNSWNRIFLKVNIMEDGAFWLSSHYYGKEWLDHTSIKVYDRDVYEFSDTLALGHPDNRKVVDGEDKWEIIDFKNGTGNRMVRFILQYGDRRLKARFTGKKHYYIVMEGFDKEAIQQGYELAQVLKEIHELRQKIERRQKELRLLGFSADSLNP